MFFFFFQSAIEIIATFTAIKKEYDSDDASALSCSDVESFQGKIVYNPDGSAFIIDSENESLSNISSADNYAAGMLKN